MDYFVIEEKLPSLNDVIDKNRTNRYAGAKYKKDIEEKISSISNNSMSGGGFTDSASDRDQYFADAGNFIIDKEKALVPESIKRFVISLSLTNSLFI